MPGWLDCVCGGDLVAVVQPVQVADVDNDNAAPYPMRSHKVVQSGIDLKDCFCLNWNNKKS